MSSGSKPIDRFFLTAATLLTVAGFVIFLSASLGLLTQNGASFGSVAMKQAISLAVGIGAFFIFSKVNHTLFRKNATLILAGAIIINLLLFIPSLTLHYNGATRWIDLGFLSFQPSEFLKIAAIIYFAAWVQFARERIRTLRFGLLPYIAIMAVLGTLLLIQSDTDTLVIIAVTGIVMFWVGGMRLKHIVLAGLFLACIVGGVIAFRPYALERVKVYLHPGANTQGSGYQINQSLIAIGSGGWTGRGFGQSIQKFGYLPQPTDDSIFAVAAEEFGFIGGCALLAIYCIFAGSVFRIGNKSSDAFGGLVAIGFAVLVIIESFMNMAAMLGIIPISGVPLLFVSHGGTALIIILAAAGIVANVSKTMRT